MSINCFRIMKQSLNNFLCYQFLYSSNIIIPILNTTTKGLLLFCLHYFQFLITVRYYFSIFVKYKSSSLFTCLNLIIGHQLGNDLCTIYLLIFFSASWNLRTFLSQGNDFLLICFFPLTFLIIKIFDSR